MSIDSTLKFFVDQISDQHKELKADLFREFTRHDSKLDQFMDDTEQRLVLMEEQLLSIQKFKWTILGGSAFVMAIVEIGLRVFDAGLK